MALRAQQNTNDDLRDRIAAAKHAGFEELFQLRFEWLAPANAVGKRGSELQKLGVETFLPWCRNTTHCDQAAHITATFARRYGERILVRGGDANQVIDLFTRVWPYRRQAAYRACELALTLADAYRLKERFVDAEHALDFCDEIVNGTAWTQWNPIEKLMVPIHRLQLECRRAALELSLGNPDGMFPHLLRADRILGSQRGTPPPRFAASFDAAWHSAAALLRREEIECYVGNEQFATAATAAEEALVAARAVGDPADIELAAFYLAMARSWDNTRPAAEQASALVDLEKFAAEGSPVRQRAIVSMIELRAKLGDHAGAAKHLDQVQVDGQLLAPRVTTAQTELMLLRDREAAVPLAELRQQKRHQHQAFVQLLDSWRATPRRDSGVGFLHFLFRRETIGQLVAVTLRAAREAGAQPPESAVKEALQFVMATQTHGALAQRLGTAAPRTTALQALLPQKHGVLVFLPTRSQTHVFVITREQVAHHSLAQGAMSIREDIHGFVRLLQRATGKLTHEQARAAALAKELRATGTAVRNTLLPAPLLKRLRDWRSVTVIGSELLHGPIAGSAEAGFLNYLPIECLPWDGSELLGQHVAIDHNVSLPVWAKLAQQTAKLDAASPVTVFGVLNEGGKQTANVDKDDAMSRKHIKAMTDAFEHATAHLEENCTVARVKNRARSNSDNSIAIFLAHGGYDASSPRGSFLELFDGRLHCDAAQQLGSIESPVAQLVVLAACRAAKAPTRAGDSLANLGGAFQLAGAKTVVQSRFDLPLRRTEALLTDFMLRLSKGSAIAEAMRAARASGSAGDPLDAYRTGVLQVHGFGQAPPER